MALYPAATKKLIPPGANDPKIEVIGAILHVAAGTSTSLYPYFNGPSGGIESHFYVQEHGTTEQYRDTAYEADANYHGNSFMKDGVLCGYASIETWGLEPDSWNPEQLDEIKRLLSWLSKTHNFPLRKCASPTSPGVGYHVMWGAPGPWTPVAKSCPGPKRVAQYNNILVPWMAQGGQEDDMPLNDADKTWLKAMVYDQNELYGKNLWAAPTGTGTALRAQVASLTTQVAGLSAAVQTLAGQQGVDPAAVIAAVKDAADKATREALADLKITLSTEAS